MSRLFKNIEEHRGRNYPVYNMITVSDLANTPSNPNYDTEYQVNFNKC